ncbi:MAG: hypothetical protein IKS08_04635 [Alphaproteobacteria bacterium]|nr:hypothetical protein [Alphaproteobacteria bacterium]
MAMKKPMVSAIVFFTIVLLMASFGFSLDDTPAIVLPESVKGRALFVCPAESSFWDAMSIGFGQFTYYILIGFFFAVIVLAFVWGWALYQNLLQDKFKREDFAKPWGFTKLLFWAGVALILILHTPNHYRGLEIRGTTGNWVTCESTSEGARAVSINLVEPK